MTIRVIQVMVFPPQNRKKKNSLGLKQYSHTIFLKYLDSPGHLGQFDRKWPFCHFAGFCYTGLCITCISVYTCIYVDVLSFRSTHFTKELTSGGEVATIDADLKNRGLIQPTHKVLVTYWSLIGRRLTISPNEIKIIFTIYIAPKT